MQRRLLLLAGLVLGIAMTATPLFAGGEEEGSSGGTAAAMAATGSDIVKVVGRYTVRESWLSPPTASQVGITTFQEAPMLAAMVQAGDLPPVEDRLPDDPLVLEPYSEVGKYGGELRVARTGPTDYGDMFRGAKTFLFRADPTLNEIIPHGAKGYELSDDRTVLTFYLREGMKWSDGMPFTTADFMWIYDNVWQNPDIPSQSIRWSLNGELSKWEAVDDYTLSMTFPAPLTPTFLVPLLNFHRTRQGNIYTPVHYAEQFHADFNPKAEEMAKAEGFENWIAHFNARIPTPPSEPYVQPKLAAWVLESRDSTGKFSVRNPYFFAVDSAGNQLPYIDTFRAIFFADKQVAILNMMQGKVDIGGRLMDPGSFALYKQNEEVGGYNLREWQDTKTSRVIFMPNLNSTDEVKGPVLADKRFRQALSLAINRQEINEFVFLGLATPAQYTTDSGAAFYDEAWSQSYAAYDPEGAKAKLDEMGMTDRDGDGWREAPGGEEFILDLRPHTSSVLGTMGDNISELVRTYWEEIGININYKQIAQELQSQLLLANELDVVIFVAEHYMPSRLSSPPPFGHDVIIYSTEWRKWYVHQRWVDGGRQGDEPLMGTEPPPEWKQWLDDWHAWVDAPNDAEFNRIGAKVWAFQAEELPIIGTVAKAVRPIIINNRIRNVPDVLPFSFESFLWVQTVPAQWYIDE